MRFKRSNLYLNLKKYKFFIIKIEFISFIISIINVFINKRKIKIIHY